MSYGIKAAERLAGKTVLLTGASSGIGRSTAIELAAAAQGRIRLILAARRLERLESLQKELEKSHPGINVLPTTLDVSKYREVPKYLESLPKEWSKIDILINNAGMVHGLDPVGEIDVEDFEIMYFTNVLGLIALTNALVPQFRARNSGDVVMIGSIAGIDPYPKGSIYCSTKASLKSFSDALRKETIDSRIRVIEVDPGAVETEFSVVRFRGDKAKADAVYAGTEPMVPEDIAEVITFALTRRENTVLANALVFPSHQAGAGHVYKKP